MPYWRFPLAVSHAAALSERMPLYAYPLRALGKQGRFHPSVAHGRSRATTWRPQHPISPGKEAAWPAGVPRVCERYSTGTYGCPFQDATRRRMHRADLPARHFRTLVAGYLRIQTQGAEVGQVNGLAVSHAGPRTDSRTTSRQRLVSPGRRHQHRARSRPLWRHPHERLLHSGRPVALSPPLAPPTGLSASIAFERSYGASMGTPRPAPRCVAC